MKKRILLLIMLIFIGINLTSCSKTFVVTFDSNGGTQVESIEVKKGKRVERPSDPIKEGYIFLFWALDNNEYDFETKVYKDITLEAIWSNDSGNVKRLNQPQNLKLSDNTLTWDKVPGAVSYEVYVNGHKYETENESYQVTVDTALPTTITVVAKSSNSTIGDSIKSSVLLYETKLSIKEIEQILEQTIPSEITDEEYEMINKLALASKQYNISFSEIENVSSSIELLEYIENGRTKDILGYILIVGNLYFNSIYQGNIKEPILEVEIAEIQELFNSLKKAEVYISNFIDVKDDAKFMNLVLPEILPLCDRKGNVFNLLRKVAINSNYTIIRNDSTITFDNNITNETYTMSLEEIEVLLAYYNSNDMNMDVPDAYNEYYQDKMRYLERLNNSEISNGTYAQVLDYCYNNLDELASVIDKIYDSYNIALGYVEKYQEIVSKLQEYESAEQFKAALNDAKAFALQVANLLSDTLPTTDECKLIVELLEAFSFLGINIKDTTIDSVTNLVIVQIETIKLLLQSIEDIDVEDVLKAMMIMTDPSDTDALKAIKNIANVIVTKISNIKNVEEFNSMLVSKLCMALLDIYISVSPNEEMGSLYSLISIAFNVQFTDEEAKKIDEEIVSFIEYLDQYDMTNLISCTESLIYNRELTDDMINEFCKLIDYIFDYVKTDHIEKYEKYIKGLITSFIYNNKNDSIECEKIYNTIKNNFNGFKDYYKLLLKLSMYFPSQTATNEEMRMMLQKQLQLIKDSLTNDSAQNIAKAFKELNQIWNNEEDFTLLEDNFINNINQLINLLDKYELEITTEDKELIHKLFYMFNINWVYPNFIECQFNEANQKLQVILSDDFLEKFSEVTLDSYQLPFFTLQIIQETNYRVRGTMVVNRENLPDGIIYEIDKELLLNSFKQNLVSIKQVFIYEMDVRLIYNDNEYKMENIMIDITTYVITMLDE